MGTMPLVGAKEPWSVFLRVVPFALVDAQLWTAQHVQDAVDGGGSTYLLRAWSLRLPFCYLVVDTFPTGGTIPMLRRMSGTTAENQCGYLALGSLASYLNRGEPSAYFNFCNG